MNETIAMTEKQHLPRQRTVEALAEAMFPAGELMPAPDPVTIRERVADYVAQYPWLRRALVSGLAWVEARFWATHGKRFTRANVATRRAFLERVSRTRATGTLLQAATAPLKAAYLLDEDNQQRVGSRPRVDVPKQVESFRWESLISRPDDFESDEELEADVVVIGTGAGGAVAAYELASRGLAVVMLEEGDYYNRTHFNGELTEVVPKLYRAYGATAAIGNVFIPVPIGRSVGGSTTINSGTCMRPPKEVLDGWRHKLGLKGFTEEDMAPYFREVEEVLQVEEADPKYVGEIGHIIQQGAESLGFRHYHPLTRNAPGCDGQGLCQFGCPTDAKQSTNVSYVPRALERGAFLFTGFRAEKLLRDGQKVRGVVAQGQHRETGKPVKLTLKASRVIVATGTFLTPQFLKENGVRNRHLGRHLTLHPAGVVNGIFPDRDMQNSRTIPQGYALADFADEGLMFEGGTIPFAGHGILNNLYGEEFVHFTERYQQTAYFGFMLRDTSEGRVRRGPHRDIPWIQYRMNSHDFALFLKGIRTLARVYFAAGASEVLIPGPNTIERLKSEKELEAFMARRHKPADFMMSAYHPLGTARISNSAEEGVCDPDHQVHGWEGLYVMDGSNVPSSLGVNPQITIMALASMAAAKVAAEIAS